MSQDEAGLLPCPFCGGKAKHHSDDPFEWPRCSDCGSEGPKILAHKGGWSAAVIAWNRRDPAASLTAENARLREALTVRTWTEEECDGMAVAFREIEAWSCHYETLFAVAAWILRYRAALASKEPTP